MGNSPLYPLTPAGVAADIATAIREQNRGWLPQVGGSYIVPGWKINDIVDGLALVDNAPEINAKVIKFDQLAYIEKASIVISHGGAGMGAKIRLALYKMDPTSGKATDLHVDYGVFNVASSGQKHISILGSIPPGLYWEVCFFNTSTMDLDGWSYRRSNRAGTVGEVQELVQGPGQDYIGPTIPVGNPGAESRFDTYLSYSNLYLEDTSIIEGWVTNGAPQSLAEYTFYNGVTSAGRGPLVFYKLSSN